MLTLKKLNNSAADIQLTGKYTNPIILKLECQVQIIAFQIPYLFIKSIFQDIHIQILMISNEIRVFLITLNPFGF